MAQARASIRRRAVMVPVLVPAGLVVALENAGLEIVPHRRPVVQAVLVIVPRPVVRIADRVVLVDQA